MFQKGVSGNPRGRPKLGTSLTDQLRTVAAQEVDGKTRMALLAAKVFELAIGGDLRAAELIWNRLEGTAVQRAETSDSVEITVRYVNVSHSTSTETHRIELTGAPSGAGANTSRVIEVQRDSGGAPVRQIDSGPACIDERSTTNGAGGVGCAHVQETDAPVAGDMRDA
jgi:hypothetical protein